MTEYNYIKTGEIRKMQEEEINNNLENQFSQTATVINEKLNDIMQSKSMDKHITITIHSLEELKFITKKYAIELGYKLDTGEPDNLLKLPLTATLSWSKAKEVIIK